MRFTLEVDLDDIIECGDIDGFNELIDDLAVDALHISEGDMLENMNYVVVGAVPGNKILIEVTADSVSIKEDDEDENEDDS